MQEAAMARTHRTSKTSNAQGQMDAREVIFAIRMGLLVRHDPGLTGLASRVSEAFFTQSEPKPPGDSCPQGVWTGLDLREPRLCTLRTEL